MLSCLYLMARQWFWRVAHPSSAGKQRAGGSPLWRRQGPPLDFPGVPHSRGFAAEGRRRGCVATRQPLPFRPPVRRTALHLATQIFVGRGFRAFCVPSLLSGSHDIRTRRAAPFLSRRRSCEVFEFSRHTSARPAWSRANPEPARQPIRRILKPAHHVVTGTSFYYYAEDMLGNSRSLTTSTGSLCYDADFYPFGGEHQFTNSCPQNYKFTGKERDAETGNDDYDARYYSSAYGRFLSADWSAVPAPVPYANLTNPQTLNLYAMVSDNPETFADLDGHLNASPGDPRQGPCVDSGTTACGEEQQKQSAQSSAAQGQAQNTNTRQVGNVVHNETGGLRPKAKEGSGSSQDLHNAKVAVADVVKNREKAGNNGGVASDKVSSKERNTPQYKDSQKAAAEAARSDVTGGSTHFYLDYGQKPPSWAAGKETTTFGPFKNAAGGGDVPKGADVKIIIVHPENQQ